MAKKKCIYCDEETENVDSDFCADCEYGIYNEGLYDLD